MAYTLNGTSIKRPSSLKETNSTQYSQVRTLSGAVARDYFGSNKRIWVLDYVNCNPTDYSTIKTIYTTYLSDGSAKTWAIDETNYTVTSTTVHIDLVDRGFKVKGTSYLSDFSLVLVEA